MNDAGWRDSYSDKLRTAEQAIGLIPSGKRIFIGSCCGEPQHLVNALLDQAERFSDLEIVRLLSLEGSIIALFSEETGGRNFNVRSIYQGSGDTRSLAANKRFLASMNLFSVPRLFIKRQLPLHFALIQVSPPDEFGFMSLGVSVDVTLAAAQSAGKVIAQVNPKMPRVPGYGFIHVNDVDLIVEKEEDLLTVYDQPESASSAVVAGLVANLVEDGSTIQIGPGSLTTAILRALADKKDLGVHSTFMVDGLMDLMNKGAVNNKKKGLNDGKSVASAALGSEELYRFLDRNPAVEFRPSDYVNNPGIIAEHNRMTAINMATTMDLKGQVAADALPQNHFSGVTGMIDFVRGAAMSNGGRSVIVLPCTEMLPSPPAPLPHAGEGWPKAGARVPYSCPIVPELAAGSVVVPAGDVSYVVSEFGAVNLFGKSNQERAMAMISLAHPDARDELFHRAQAIGLIGKERTLKESLFGVYPAKMEETRELKGGRVTFRPAKTVDERLIQEHFYEMDRKDIATRFFGIKTSFSRTDMESMFEVDYRNNLSIVAITGEETGFGKIVGVGVYMIEPAKSHAEVAYSVSKEWQGKGIAVILQNKIAEAAIENGISGLEAFVLMENKPMINLFKKLPYKVKTSLEEGVLTLSCSFDELA